MFEINDYVMYGMTGVCKIIDIKKESIIDNMEKEYYVLSHIFSKDTIIKTPVNSEKLNMRKIISLDDVTSLIHKMPTKECVWIEDERKRNEQFKMMIKSGNIEELISIIRSIYLDKEFKEAMGKKSYKNDIDIMENAERLLNEEFATILNIPINEVTPYILNNVPK